MRAVRIGQYLGVIVLLAFIVAGVTYYLTTVRNDTQQQTARPPSPVEVTPPVKRMIAEKLEAIGNARPYESVTLSANVTEYIKRLHFEDGDQVKKGDLLVELETAEEKAQLAEAKARLLEANQHYARIKNLLKKDFSAQSEYDMQKANVESAKAQVLQIEAIIADRNITAPFDGVLGFRLVSEGTLIESGDNIATLDMIAPLRIDFTVPEHYLQKLYEGQPFSANTVAYPSKTFNGKVQTINARIDEASRAVTLRGVISNKRLLLKPGMLLHIVLKLSEQEAWVLPEQALQAKEDKRYVYVVPKGETKAKRVDITLIRRDGPEILVKAPLKKTDRVIIKGGFKLQDHQEVLIQNVAQ